MVTVLDKCDSRQHETIIICDFTPPRGADAAFVDQAQHLSADFICVAYSPGKAVRMDSAIAAYLIRQRTNKDVVFNLATRDMNKLALQNHLLGAFALGLENVVVLSGDVFSQKDLSTVMNVSDFKPSGLVSAVRAMNDGIDYKGLKLRSPTRLCIGSTVDLGKGVESQVALTRRKAAAGADFFITQPVYDLRQVAAFQDQYRAAAGKSILEPIFYGVHILDKDGVLFNDVPESIMRDLENGRSGEDVAMELVSEFMASGIKTIYLIPPILRGGARDYAAAQRLLDRLDK
jgi:5,10-methylenetetrahydrofolate reductase